MSARTFRDASHPADLSIWLLLLGLAYVLRLAGWMLLLILLLIVSALWLAYLLGVAAWLLWLFLLLLWLFRWRQTPSTFR
ncbi:hypothetical protein [Blastopirellula marina]|uniref:hypothetical protein n=1 Tax=Blastopirellula marina TaxID=124 RepID=UPI000325E4DE|nr:hypothetical protein [Blastopirellula marina]